MTRPALVATKSRRETVELMGPPGTKRCAVRGARLLPCRSIVGGHQPAIGDNRALRTAHPCSGDFPYRQLSYSLSRRGEDRVRDGWRDGWRARLAHAALRIGRRHDMHLDLRPVGQAEHLVVVEVALLGAAFVDRDLAAAPIREPVVHGALLL